MSKREADRDDQSPNGLIDYHLLYKNSLEILVILLPVFDEQGTIVDARIEDTNRAFSDTTGISVEQAKGQLVTGLFPRREEFQKMYEAFNQVVRGGQPCRHDEYFPSFKRYFLYEIYPLNNRLIAIAAIDISEQKQAVQALQENLERLSKTEEQAIQQAAQVEVQHRLIETRENERLQVANHLHEGLLQALIGIRYSIEEGLGIEQKEYRLAKLAAVQATLQREIQDLRDYCNELRPPTLAPFGLEKTIRAYTEFFQKKHLSPEIHLDLAPDRQTLPEQTRLVLFRVFQELFKNATAHPETQEIYVRFVLLPNAAQLEISNNGSKDQTLLRWADLARQGQLNLASALERVEAVGGKLLVQPSNDGVTQITVTVPYKSV